jgi:hypothetical protein
MKARYAIILLAISSIVVLTAGITANNGRAISVGSPGEVNCNNTMCHNSYALNSGGGTIVLGSNMTSWQYVPGQTYNMTFKVKRTGNALFGMGLEALTTTNANAGNLLIINTQTQKKSGTVSGVTRTSVVHTLNGGASADSMVFAFNWQAPATNIGNVTMYFCGVAANGGNTPALDYVYKSTQVITPGLPSGIEDVDTENPVTVFPNPSEGVFYIHYVAGANQPVTIRLYSLAGQLSQEIISGEMRSGVCSEHVVLSPGTARGIYLLTIETAERTTVRKILVN